jgi:raffinose/stachyose/melibiose transport system substrate-binding protein
VNLRHLVNGFGVALLAGAFAWSAGQVALRTARKADQGAVTVRIAHWQLESGMREAFDEVAREYARLHPGVRVINLAVPGRVYGLYVRTRLTGGDPPDLLQLGDSGSAEADEQLSRHFVPLTPWIEQPNPCNAGTPLDGVPWRDTFLDGLANAPELDRLLEHYGVPCAAVTVRMQYNRPLYRRIMGHERPPRTYAEFAAVCEATETFARREGLPLAPVAGSRFNANVLMERLFRSQTQRLALDLDPLGTLRGPPHAGLPLLEGRLTMDDPAVVSGYTLMRDVGRRMPDGFMQFDRDEAIFQFGQGRALMIATGSWDFRGILSQSPFEVGVFPMPLPDANDERFGRFTLGPAAEAGQVLATTFHLARNSRHPEHALGFLQFLTSQRGNQMFVNRSKWLPAIVGVAPPEEVRDFAPVEEGYSDGFQFAPVMWGSGEMYRVHSKHLHRLLDREGSVEAFLTALRDEWPAAVRADVERSAHGTRTSLARNDILLLANRWMEQSEERRGARASVLLETQNQQELLWHVFERALRGTEAR